MKNWTAVLILAHLAGFGAPPLRAQGNALLVGPTALSFTYVGAGLQPSSQGVLVAASGAPLSFTAAATTVGGGTWLRVSPTAGTTPATLAVSVSPGALGPGTYRGTVAISAAGAANPAVLIGVNLVVRTTTQIAADPLRLSFQHQTGTAPPAARKIAVTSNGAPLAVQVSAESFGAGEWLEASPSFVNTPGEFEVRIQPGDLGPGVYAGRITLGAPGATNTPIAVEVGLTVSASPFLAADRESVAFAHQVGMAAPPPQGVTVSSTGGPVAFSVATGTPGGEWLRAGPPTGTTPATAGVWVEPADLAPGPYTGFVTFSSSAAANSPLRVPVSLTVAAGAHLRPSPSQVAFDYQIGGPPPAAQMIGLGGGGAAMSFNVAPGTKTGGPWLAVGPLSGATDSSVTATVNAANLTAGLYEGSLRVTAAGAANSPVEVPVTLNVTGNPLLQPSPAALSFAFQTGGSAPPGRTVAVTSSGTPLSYTVQAAATAGGTWLHAGAPGGTTPGTFTVSVTPAGLAPGVYTGAITIAAAGAGNSPAAVPVTLVVSDTALLAVDPPALRLAAGGSPQVLNLTTTDGTPLSYSVATVSAGGWLQASPRGGAAPGSLTVSANAAGLSPGAYPGQVVIHTPASANSPQVVPVTLTVAPALTAVPSDLAFHHTAGAAAPAAQTVALGGVGLSFTASASTSAGGDWLRVAPAAGTTPASLSVSVHPTGLAPGSYHGTVAVTAPQAANSPLAIGVRLTVAGAGAVPVVNAVVNGASFQAAPVAPGLIATLFGSGMGPEAGAGLRLTAAGLVDTSAAGTRVLFDSTPAPILYASGRQVSVVVPYALSGRGRARVEVEYQGARSAPVEVQVAESAPGVFTLNSTGIGPGAILNEDGRVNTPDNPAPRGSIVVLYATGEGHTSPAGIDGLVTAMTLRHPVLPVRVAIAGQETEVLYAGAAPGLVSGVLQVNARVPAAVAPRSAVPVVVTVGSASSQAGVTVAVR